MIENFAEKYRVIFTTYILWLVITALLGMQTRSVRLSVKRGDCDKREEKSVQIFIPYERSFNLVF